MTTIDILGFHRTRLDERMASLVSALQAIFGDIDVGAESPDGQLLGIFAEAISDLDQLAETIFNGRSPSGAQGAALARLALLNGVTRKGASYSTAPITLTGVIGTLVPAGSLIATGSTPPVVFQTTADLTLVDDGGHIYGAVTGQVRATLPGPLLGVDISHIQTVISGWTGASNATPAAIGTDIETDAALRARRLASVALPSQGILDGLFAALAAVPGVTHLAVYENPTDAVIGPPTIKGGTLAPHAIQAIVDGSGDPVKIAEALWLKKSLGVTQVGAVSRDFIDTQGFPHTMSWDIPVPVIPYVIIWLDASVGPTTKGKISQAVADWGVANAQIGKDIVFSQLYTPINSIPGLSVFSLFLGRAPGPTLSANLVINFNEIAQWDATNVLVLP